MKKSGKRTQAKAPALKDCAWDSERERTATRRTRKTTPYFHFDYGKDWMETTCLLPIMLVVKTSRVDVEIHRAGILYDEGSFWVAIEPSKQISISGFKHCFDKIRDGNVLSISAAHLQEGDTIILKNIHNGMYQRSHKLAERGEPSILSLHSLPDLSARRQQAEQVVH